MHLGSSFVVPATPDRVFALFLDADTMRRCIPGCTELSRTDDTHFRGQLVNKVAHVQFNAAFSAEILEIDDGKRLRALLKGEDRRIASSLQVEAVLAVEPKDDAGSTVTYEMEMALWGKIGRLGESIVRRRTAEVEQQFVRAFSAACAGELPAEGPAEGQAAAHPRQPEREHAMARRAPDPAAGPAPRPRVAMPVIGGVVAGAIAGALTALLVVRRALKRR